MGGLGSTRWRHHRRAPQVETAKRLPLSRLAKELAPSTYRKGLYSCHGQVLELCIDLEARRATLDYRLRGGEVIHDEVVLATTTPHFGGVRWWVVCPGCHKRRADLFITPGRRHFRCRSCHGLTYRSAQHHDQRVDNLRRLLSNGRTFTILRRTMLDFTDPTWSVLAYIALKKGPLKKPRPSLLDMDALYDQMKQE